MKKNLEILAFVLILGVSIVFGFMGKTTEMGMAIFAGMVTFAFVNFDKISEITGAGFSVKFREQLKAIVEKETELVEPSGGATVEGYGLVGDANKIVLALKNPNFTWRYSSGLIKESGADQSEVDKTLEWLHQNGLAKESKGKHGKIWSLTLKGREAFSNLS